MLTPHPVPLPAASSVLRVRSARQDDAAALAALSRPFVRSGALRERPASLYVRQAAEFLVAEAADGTLDGCVALRVHAASLATGQGPVGVLYNFCVAGHRQGNGVGARLMTAVLARAGAQSLTALYTATVGSGGLFLRHGFTPASPRTAPPAWTRSLDPRRGARVLARFL
ncbi:GNAT family N-acetyltransferase [Streptomyces sp. NPDC006872]|uniref:GNAT family N-acetyltransferase n=1 Tax=Streptomyces sp. NPDC006872 TaxID=3155720 RepID=UPI00340539A0